MSVVASEKKILGEYLELQLSIIKALKNSPRAALLRGMDVFFVFSPYMRSANDIKKIPLNVFLSLLTFMHELERLELEHNLKKDPEFVEKKEKLENSSSALPKKLITQDMLDAMRKELSLMPKQEKNSSPSPLGVEQRKVFLDILNAALVNMEVRLQSNTEKDRREIDSIRAKVLHLVAKQANALGIDKKELNKDTDIFVRIQLIDNPNRYSEQRIFSGSESYSKLIQAYPCFFEKKQALLSPEEIKQASYVLFNQEQVRIIKKMCVMFKEIELAKSDTALNQILLKPLYAVFEDFSRTHDAKIFRKKIDQILKDSEVSTMARFQPSIFKQAYDAVVFVLRAFFRVFDHLVSTITFREKLMRDTGTPFAKFVTGKSNFFTYTQPSAEETQNKALLIKIKSDLDDAIEQFKEADFLYPHATPSLN